MAFLYKKGLFFYVFKQKSQPNLEEIVPRLKFVTKNERKFYKLNKSQCERKIARLKFKDKGLLFCELYYYKNITFLKSISRVIDKKINDNKQKFRGIGGISFVDALAEVLIKNQNLNNNLSNALIEINKNIKLQNKERQILKFLISKNLISSLFEQMKGIAKIREVIDVSKNAKSIQNYRKNIYKTANYYAICKFGNKFNQNLQNRKFAKIDDLEIKKFIKTLYLYDDKIKAEINILKCLFS